MATIIDEIRDLEDAYARAARDNDADAMEQLLHDDCVLINSGMGNLSDKSEQLELLRTGKLQYRQFDAELLDVRLCDETTAIARSLTSVSVLRENRMIRGDFWITKVYVKEEGRWTIISGQSTRVEP